MNVLTTDHPLVLVKASFNSTKHPFRSFVLNTFVCSLFLTPLWFALGWYSEATDEIAPPTGERMFPPDGLPGLLIDAIEAFFVSLLFAPMLLFVCRLLIYVFRQLLRFRRRQNRPSPMESPAVVPLRQWAGLFCLAVAIMVLTLVVARTLNLP